MAKINVYDPETDGASPAPSLDPNLTVVGRAGAGLEKFGEDVTQELGVVDRRREQTETADAYSNIAQARADFTQQLQQQTDDGTLNSSQFQQQYQDWADDQANNYNTPGGRDYFQRQSARLQSSLTRTAANGQAKIAYNNGKASWQQSLDNDVATVTSDPTQHDDIVASNFENLDQMVKDGRLKESDVPAFQQQAQQQIAIGAIRGTSRQNPQLAQKILDDGKLNSVLTPAQQQGMYQEVKTAQTAKMVDQDRAFELQKKQQEAFDQHYMDQNFTAIRQGQISAQQIDSSGMSFQKRNEAINMIKNAGNEDMQTANPQQFNNIVNKIGNGEISDPGVLYKYGGATNPSQRLSLNDIGKLRTFIDQSPAGQTDIANRKMLLDSAKATIFNNGALSPIGYTAGKDPVAEYGLSAFTQALQAKEDEFRQAGKPISGLHLISSPDYFGKNAAQYKPSPEMRLQMQYGKPTTQLSPFIAAPSVQGSTVAPPTSNTAPTEPMVNVIDPRGKKGKIPKSQLKGALAAGYEEM